MCVLRWLLVCAVVSVAPATGEDAGLRVVQTRHGAARGIFKASSTGRRFLAFYNLPYAKPPVGPLRFQNPQPPESWVHVRDATTPGPMCTQNTPFLAPVPVVGTEDCLYLNVFTPTSKPVSLLPVMFWIHGGGWSSGGSTWVEPDFLLDHNVVLVTINYRLGPLGFLSTGDAAAPGNFGFKDMVAALEWVKENVEAFGGDPGCVTIFGESAGGASVHYLLLSPLSKGLFHRAISQSGVALTPWAVSLGDAPEKARKVAATLGCPTEPSDALVECLRSVDDHQLTFAETHFLESFYNPLIPFRPVVEPDGPQPFLPKHPLHLEPSTSVPWIVGLNKDEGCLKTRVLARNKTLLRQLEQNRKTLLPLSLLYHTSLAVDMITEKVYDFYFSPGELTLDKLTLVYSDALFNWNTDEAVRLYKNIAPVYYYLLSYEGVNKMEGTYHRGVCHGDDLFYLFSNNSYDPVQNERTAKDMEVVKLMTKFWTTFATYGNPTPSNDSLHWPRVTSDEELEYLDIGETLQVKKGLFQERVQFWKSLPIRETEHHSVRKEEL